MIKIGANLKTSDEFSDLELKINRLAKLMKRDKEFKVEIKWWSIQARFHVLNWNKLQGDRVRSLQNTTFWDKSQKNKKIDIQPLPDQHDLIGSTLLWIYLFVETDDSIFFGI